MTKIKITRALGGHKAGDTIDGTPKSAAYITARGHVEETKTRSKKTDDTTGDTE